MSDIAKRLRRWAAPTEKPPSVSISHDLRLAADEIERLSGQLHAIRLTCAELTAEVDCLRAALSGLIKCADAGFWPEDEELEAARAALAKEGQ